MPSYLDDTFLGQAEDDGTTEIGSADNMPLVRQDSPPPAPMVEMMRLPGGIILPKRTAMIILAIVVAIAIYIYLNRKRKDD